ncbi:uncharacterized protein A1O9_04632 [Exophiala aquamarina CBS 119918]|uniref:Uncharacterized protein n=1 Tax=Exophiala aquamarina CBS 119918 TaxID=1182545 RepID=A0A072PI82_9EURO|nr:uncharacterized protein A1O9_04632 [Exophiala aquamarina CBS 119918]KEF59784.1 hypothetical protein A1O9_04632 [Exophiala aquamarina CBS 119918]
MASSRRIPLLAFFTLVTLYLGLDYAGFRISITFPYVIKTGNSEGPPLSSALTPGGYNPATAQVERILLCAVNRKEDLSAQSQNQTVLTTNLLLACPHLADAMLGSQKKASFIWQLHSYLTSQLQQPRDERLDWMFFLKDHDMLYSHTPRSLRKFLPPSSAKIEAISFGHDSAQQALGFFAIRIDQWIVSLLQSVLQLREERPSLTDNEALTLVLTGSDNAGRVAYAPQWWLDVGSSCVEGATWEAQFGVSYVATTDQLCCVHDPCRDALGQITNQASGEGVQGTGPQKALKPDSGAAVERAIGDFWKIGQFSPRL